ncbi:tyrosine recombinase [Plakobranchus ocellatus]|uniref:Tyrosine recombinase n=1 Tax=Plakobranchus ocellatus TaxID=259542 RepID=A0AAV3YEU0_9GAST|nr:tyrosine recombinase [Plakobranchus ocellatus]
MTFNLLPQLTERSTNKEDEDEGSPVDDVGVEIDDESDVNFDVEEGEGDGLVLLSTPRNLMASSEVDPVTSKSGGGEDRDEEAASTVVPPAVEAVITAMNAKWEERFNRVVELLSSSSSDHTGKRLHAALSEGEVSSPNSPAGPSKRTKITAFASEEEWGGQCDERDRQTVDSGDVELDDEEELLCSGGAQEKNSGELEAKAFLAEIETGFVVHPEKSMCEPSKVIQYLGVIINSDSMTLKLTEKRANILVDTCSELLQGRQCIIRDVAVVVGKMVSSFPAKKYGPLYYRHLDRDKNVALNRNRRNFDALMTLSDRSRYELQWNFGGAGLADTDVVPFGSPAFMQTTHSPSLQEGPPSPPRLTRNDSSTAFAEETGPAGLQSLRSRFEATGLNDDAIHFVMNSWRPNTAKSYSTYIKKWLDYIASNNIQDIMIATFANFLSTLYIHGNGYSTINLARSAVAAFLAPGGFVGFGTHPIITKLLRGVFHKRPALSKYTSTWNVDVVIKFLSEWPDLNVMTLKQLTLRLVMLLCLLSGQRGETIYKIRVNDISFHDNNCFMVFSSLLKTSNPRRHLQPLELRSFTNKRLCVVSHLQHYLAVTQDFRLGDQLFLTYIKPHRPIARGTLSRWIKMILKMAGVNTDVYSAHSTRVASTSAAMVRNVPLDVILRSAGWSKKSTFEKFYFRNIPSCEPNFTDNVSGACFANAILSKGT